MTRAAILLSIMFTFDASPSADVTSYRCETWQIRMAEIPAAPGCPAPCMRKTPPLSVACTVVEWNMPSARYAAHVYDVPLGSVMYGYVVARDASGNESEQFGWTDPDPLLLHRLILPVLP